MQNLKKKRSGCSYKIMLAVDNEWVPMFNDKGKPVIKKSLKEAMDAVKKETPGFFDMGSGKYIQYPFEIVETCVNIEMVRHNKVRTVYTG